MTITTDGTVQRQLITAPHTIKKHLNIITPFDYVSMDDEPDIVPEWDESWPTTRTADRVNLGATAGYTLDVTDGMLYNHETYPFDTFTKDGTGGVHLANDGSSLALAGTTSSIPVVANRVYEFIMRGDLVTGTGFGISINSGVGAAVLDGVNDDPESRGWQSGILRKFYSAATTRNVAIGFTTSNVGVPREFTMSDIQVKEIIPQVVTNYIYRTVCCWGDSHTEGMYPYRLRHLVTNAYVYNGGVGGEGSTQIAARFLAATDKYDQPHIIWAGNINSMSVSTVLADIASMVTAMGHNRYRIIGVMGNNTAVTGSSLRTAITELNAALLSAYGPRFLDIEAYLLGIYDTSIPQDVTDHNNGIIATSLRVDTTHLTYDGYDLVAAKIVETWPDFFVFQTVPTP